MSGTGFAASWKVRGSHISIFSQNMWDTPQYWHERISAAGTPEDPVTLVTVGGDGTIYEVLTGIIDLSSVVFGFIPVGSGNDFCRSMGLPFDPFEALRSILENRRTIFMDVPVLHLGSHSYRFGISAGMGYDAAICPGSPDHTWQKISQPSPYG